MKRTAITDETKATFLANLAEGHTVKFAASAVGVERRTMYRLREEKDGEDNLTSEAAEFRDAWDEAFEAGVQMLEEEARRRAVEGIPGPKGTTSFSDTLLIFLLKSKRPNVYRDNARVELTGADGGPVELELAHDQDEIRAALVALVASPAVD